LFLSPSLPLVLAYTAKKERSNSVPRNHQPTTAQHASFAPQVANAEKY